MISIFLWWLIFITWGTLKKEGGAVTHTKDFFFWGKKIAHSHHIDFLLSSLACNQIWPSPLVDDCTAPTSHIEKTNPDHDGLLNLMTTSHDNYIH
jgi:hypothetical protein